LFQPALEENFVQRFLNVRENRFALANIPHLPPLKIKIKIKISFRKIKNKSLKPFGLGLKQYFPMHASSLATFLLLEWKLMSPPIKILVPVHHLCWRTFVI
jgi:hypothetical protein